MVNPLIDPLWVTEVWSNWNLPRRKAWWVLEVSTRGETEESFFHQPPHSHCSRAAIQHPHTPVTVALTCGFPHVSVSVQLRNFHEKKQDRHSAGQRLITAPMPGGKYRPEVMWGTKYFWQYLAIVATLHVEKRCKTCYMGNLMEPTLWLPGN